jgi:CAAX protease family protein
LRKGFLPIVARRIFDGLTGAHVLDRTELRRFAIAWNSSSSTPGLPAGHTEAGPSIQRQIHRVFLGPDGIRSGWRVLSAICLWIFFSTVFTVVLVAIPAVSAWIKTQNLRIMTPSLLIFGEGTALVAAILTAVIFARLEKRSFAEYGLPLSWESVKRAAQGLVFGFAMVSALMGLIAAAKGFSIGERALSGADAARYGLAYLLAFAMLAFFEEFSFRGYMQATLAPAIGFWPAAIVLSIFFAIIHLGNPGETALGLVTPVCFGLLAAFALERTASIWLPIGIHLMWDWGLTYFYSVPDSGVSATGRLMSATLRGPVWLTGGLAGPEGSAFAFVVLGLAAVAIHFVFPAREKPI